MENLDGMSQDELLAVAGTFSTLRRYALKKERAMACRATGNISAALSHERDCEDIYKTLPQAYRW